MRRRHERLAAPSDEDSGDFYLHGAEHEEERLKRDITRALLKSAGERARAMRRAGAERSPGTGKSAEEVLRDLQEASRCHPDTRDFDEEEARFRVLQERRRKQESQR